MGGVRWAQCGVVHLAIPVLAAGQVLLHESCNSLKEMLVILFPLSCHGYCGCTVVVNTHTGKDKIGEYRPLNPRQTATA